MNAIEQKQKRLVKTGIVFSISILTIFLWIYNTHKYVLKQNELCKSGIRTYGTVYNIKRTAKNEGNISSWDVYYKFKAEDSLYSGLINVRKPESFAVQDSIAILYANHNPALHQAFENEINEDCIQFSRALFKLDNVYIVIIGLLLALVVRLNEKPG